MLDHQKRFVRDAAHQLRTPLAVLKVQVQSALRGDMPAPVALQEIQATVDRATTLANQMLSLAKVEQLRQLPDFEILDWAELVRAVALDVSPLVAEKDLNFEIVTQPCHIQAHDWMLRELTRNLLHNAIHHTPAHGNLSVSIQPEAEMALLTIRDTGTGIDDALRQRLFQPFATGDSKSGSGLGLMIAREIAMVLGGTIQLCNRLDGDTIIGMDACISIPIKPPGTHFCYNQGCTYTLSAIISKVTGGNLLDYLKPRLFTPMGVENVEWLDSLEGITQGFSGLYLETESIAKFGILQLHLGEWNGDQLVPAEYLETAHEKHVDNFDSSESSDWQQGYGFQFWVCRNDAYRGDGAFGQLCVMIPQCEAVVVCTAALADMQTELDTVWKYILPALSGSFERDSAGDEELLLRLRNLTSSSSDLAIANGPLSATFARSATVAPFTDHLLSLRVESSKNGTNLTLVTHDGECNFDLVANKWSEGTLPSRHQPFSKASVLGGWVSDDCFIVEVVWPTSPHRLLLRAEVGIESVFEAKWVTEPLGSAAKSKSVIESLRQNQG